MLSLKEINEELATVDNWSLEDEALSKNFSFSNFSEAGNFVSKIAELSEQLKHHPDIIWSYDRVKLMLTTHSEKCLTKKDFELAREIDKI